MDRQTGRQTVEGQTEGGIRTDRQADRWADRQTDINTYMYSLYFLFNYRLSIKNEPISLRNKNINKNKKSQKCIYLQVL